MSSVWALALLAWAIAIVGILRFFHVATRYEGWEVEPIEREAAAFAFVPVSVKRR
jgi:hypothetical protein